MKKTFGVKFLSIMAILVALGNGLRLCEAIYFWKDLENYKATPSYLLVSGGIWLVVGATLAFGIWLGKYWAWGGAIAGIVSYEIWYWFDRFLLQRPHANWPFAMFFSAILVGISLVIIFNTKTLHYFKVIKVN